MGKQWCFLAVTSIQRYRVSPPGVLCGADLTFQITLALRYMARIPMEESSR